LEKVNSKSGIRDSNASASLSTSLNIVAYCCEHCAYAAADLAGGLRMQYPPDVKVVQLPCTGKLDVLMVLQAMEVGIDGAMVAG
jgi:F420-non-reducing hydrogenase iron-sulfur subunit